MRPTAQKDFKNQHGYKQAGSMNSSAQAKSGAATNRTKVRTPDMRWDRLSVSEKDEVEQLVEILKAVKSGDFSVRFEYEKGDILGRAGELLNDIIGLNEH